MKKTLALSLALLASAFLFLTANPTLAVAETASSAEEAGASSDKIIPVKEEKPSDYDRAVELYNRGKYREAIAVLKDYVEKRPKPEAYYLIGYAYYKLGKHDEANKYFKYSFMIDPLYSPTPGLEAKFKEPLAVARPEMSGSARPATGKHVIPKLIENRPPSDVRASEAEEADIPPAFIEELKRAREAKAPPEVAALGAEAEQVPVLPEEPESEPAPVSVSEPQAEPAPPVPAPQMEAKVEPQPPAVEVPLQETKPAPEAEAPKPGLIPAPPVPPKPEARPVPVPEPSIPAIPPPPAYGPEQVLNRYGPVVVITVLSISAILYIFFSLCLFLIARKLNVKRAWLAWVPVAQIWPIVGAAGKPWWWTLIIIVASVIPFVSILTVFVFVYLWILITENLGKNKWLGLLVIPVWFLYIPYLAFSKAGPKAGPSRKTAPVAESAEPALPDLGFDLEEGDLGPASGPPADKDDFVVEPWPEEPEGSK